MEGKGIITKVGEPTPPPPPPKVCRNGGHDKDIRRDVSVWGPSEGRCVVRSLSSAKGGHHFGTARRHHHMLQLAGHQQWVMADTAL